MAICWQIRRQNLIPCFPPSQSAPGSEHRAKDAGGEGQNFLSLSAEFREATYTNTVTHMCAEHIQETGLELLLLHFPSLRIRQLALFGCKSWGFVISNQFSALVSSALACPFLQFASCPEGPRSIPLFYQSGFSPSSAPVCVSLLPIPLYMHCRVCPSCASSGGCLPWYIIREPREHRPTRSHSSHNLCTSVLHLMLNIIDPQNKSTSQPALKQPLARKAAQ